MNSILFDERLLLDSWEDDYFNYISIIDDCVFEDSKLRKVCEKVFQSFDETDFLLEIAKYIPNTQTILYRQEVYEEVKNNKEKYEKILSKLTNLNIKYEMLLKTSNYLKKVIMFTFYVNALQVFLEEIVMLLEKTNAKLLKDLRGNIQIYLDNNKKLFTKANKLNELINENLFVKITYYQGKDYLYIQKSYEECESVEENIDRIAKLLNIKDPFCPNNSFKRELSENYLSFIFENKENKKLLEELSNFRDEYKTRKDLIINLTNLEKELKYYLKMTTLASYFEEKGLKFTKAEIGSKTCINNTHDLSLIIDDIKTTPNDFKISDKENIQFILGVNSGGKTCYLRSAIQSFLLYIMVGYCFCDEASFSHVDYVYTHFPNEEDYKIGEGRLIDEKNRLAIMEKYFSKGCYVFMNETFSSTTEEKACQLTLELIDKVDKTKANIIYVTHQYQIFELIKKDDVVYLTPEVVLDGDKNVRTHKIVKVEKGLLSYAQDILVKYGLTKEDLLRRRKVNEK